MSTVLALAAAARATSTTAGAVPGNDVGTIGLPIFLVLVVALIVGAVIFFIRRRR